MVSAEYLEVIGFEQDHHYCPIEKEAAMYDMKNLEKFKTLQCHAPEVMKAFPAFDKAAWSDGAVP